LLLLYCLAGMLSYDVRKKLSKEDRPRLPSDELEESRYPYTSVVGSLMYSLMCTRLDLAYVDGVLSRFQSNLGYSHWEGVKQVLQPNRML